MLKSKIDEMSAFHDKALCVAIQLVGEIRRLESEVEDLKEQLRQRDEYAQQRIAIEESRPPLSVGKPCPKCGQEVK
jgi:hypothetical protein